MLIQHECDEQYCSFLSNTYSIAHQIHVVSMFLVGCALHSAGVGRTGTFIAVDAMMQRLKERDDLDICTFVTQMRTKRTFMVQNLVRSYRLTANWAFSFTFLITLCGRRQNKAITYDLQNVITMCVVRIFAQCTT